MNEQQEITAIRLAKVVMSGPRKGWLEEARKMAQEILDQAKPVIVPLAFVPDVPKPQVREMCQVHIRWMIRRDMPEVLEIEHHSSATPWDEDRFIKHLRVRNCIGQVAVFDEQVVAFMVYDLHKTRFHIKNLAVHADFRWRKVGRQLIQKLVDKLSPQRRTHMVVNVRESNTSALLFLRQCGFKSSAIVKGQYEDTDEDEILMRFDKVFQVTAE